MANYFSQLGHAKELFSTDPGLHRTYFYQVIDSFKDYEKIYGTIDPVATIQTHVEEPDLLVPRRHRFLDHLIARFAEQFNDYAQIMYSVFGSNPEEMIVDKCNFLNDYPAISSGRSLACNHSLKEDQDLWDSRNISGLEKRLAKLLGIRNDTRRNLSDDATDEGMYLIENILLRPAEPDDPFLPICVDPNCAGCSENDPYSYRIHVILRGDSGRFGNIDFRRWAEGIIRSETPAHILPKVCWISKEDMADVEKLYRDWIYLNVGREPADRTKKLTDFIKTLFEVKSIYPTQKLRECGGTEDKFILGQTALGTQDAHQE